eukprot:COSAG06_NODE_25459_length_636_cov_1.052142_2_plen_21_part_01
MLNVLNALNVLNVPGEEEYLF